jgi:hypothetical protein
LGAKISGTGKETTRGFVILGAKQLSGAAVAKMQPGARWAGHRCVFMLAAALPVSAVLHLQIGFRANEDQIHSALIGASRHETMICRKALPPWEYGSARESVPILSKGRRRVHQHRLRRDRRWSRIVRTRDGPMKGSNSETGTAETKMPPLGRPTVWWEALVTCSWSRPQPAAT